MIFADLDGTFLDEGYGCHHTKPIVDQLHALGGSVVFCSSKTREEIEYYRRSAGIDEPFIAENGGTIYIPKGYFPFDYAGAKTQHYNIIRLGTSYQILRKKLAEIGQTTAAKLLGFGDMTLEELAYDTGLPLDLARLAKRREHDEPFRIVEGSRARVLRAIRHEGLKCTQGGRYLHLTGNSDKGKAVAVLKSLYGEMFGRLETYAVGDGPNDAPMLRAVDKPFFIAKAHMNARLNAWLGILHTVGATAIH